MDIPSFPAFPWLGVLLCGLFCLTVAALAGATAWVRRTTSHLKVEPAGRWNLIFGGLCLASLIGSLTVGLPALAGAWLLLTPALVAFTRRRDARVTESKRYLSGRGAANILADIRASQGGGGGVRATPRLGFRQQFAQLFGRIQYSFMPSRASSSLGRDTDSGAKRCGRVGKIGHISLLARHFGAVSQEALRAAARPGPAKPIPLPTVQGGSPSPGVM